MRLGEPEFGSGLTDFQADDRAMLVTVLVIVYQGVETITVHDAQSAAWTALMKFVDGGWRQRFRDGPYPLEEQERAKMFFADKDDLFILAEADLTELADRIDELNPDGCGCCPSPERS